MGRIRTIKPSFYKHEDLFEAEKASSLPLRLAFSGLWTVCDREGRFSWKPRTLKTDILPYDEVDFGSVLDALAHYGFIVKYEVDGREYGMVPSFHDHQVINPRESKSSIPSPNGSALVITRTDQDCDASSRVDEDENLARGEVEGKGKGKEDAIRPEMIARGVLTELVLSGRDLAIVLEEVCRAAISQWTSPEDLRDALIKAYRDYDAAKPRLTYTKGAAKFFGDGDWRNPKGWPWGKGEQPPGSAKPLTLSEKMARIA